MTTCTKNPNWNDHRAHGAGSELAEFSNEQASSVTLCLQRFPVMAAGSRWQRDGNLSASQDMVVIISI